MVTSTLVLVPMAKRYDCGAERLHRRGLAFFLIQYCFYVTFYGTATKTLNGLTMTVCWTETLVDKPSQAYMMIYHPLLTTLSLLSTL